MKFKFRSDNGTWYEVVSSQELHNVVLMSDTADPIDSPMVPYQNVHLKVKKGSEAISRFSESGKDMSELLRSTELKKIIMSSLTPISCDKPTIMDRLFGKTKEAEPTVTDNDLSRILTYIMSGEWGTNETNSE